MTAAMTSLPLDSNRSTKAPNIGALIDAIAFKVLGPPSIHRIAADIRTGHMERYVEPGIRQVYLADGVVYEAKAVDGWVPNAVG